VDLELIDWHFGMKAHIGISPMYRAWAEPP